MAAVVFISYSAKDKEIASAIHSFLNGSGVKTLKAPDDIAPGTNWAAAITQMIEQCTHMVLVWTQHSMASQEVSKELTIAMQCGATIIPFRSEDLAPEGAWRYHLSQVQWLEAHDIPEGQALESLLSQIRGTANEEMKIGALISNKYIDNSRRQEVSVNSESPSLDPAEEELSSVRTTKLTAGLLALFFGAFGVHKFFLGRNVSGSISLGFFVMAFAISLAFGSQQDAVANDADGVAGLIFVLLIAISTAEAVIYFVRSPESFLRINIRGKRAWF